MRVRKHHLRAAVGSSRAAQDFVGRWVRARGISLPQDFTLIPITDELLDDIEELYNLEEPDPFPHFSKLSAGLAAALAQSSNAGVLAYVETGYLDGFGSQHAIVWLNGAVACGPRTSEKGWTDQAVMQPSPADEAINQALRHIGVWTRRGQDEFETLGLNRFRDTEGAARTDAST